MRIPFLKPDRTELGAQFGITAHNVADSRRSRHCDGEVSQVRLPS